MKKIHAIVFGALLLVSLVPTVSANRFKDVGDKSDFADDIEALSQDGIVSGQNGMFRPGAFITRAEFLKMALISAKRSMPAGLDGLTFQDVKVTHSLAPFILYASKHGLAKGLDGKFFPDAFITRADAVKILLNVYGVDVSTITSTHFKDHKDEEHKKFVEKARELKLVSDKTDTFDPNRPLTRGEAAKLIHMAKKSVTVGPEKPEIDDEEDETADVEDEQDDQSEIEDDTEDSLEDGQEDDDSADDSEDDTTDDSVDD